MCGIAGILLPIGECIDPEWLKSLDRELSHRGPDDYGFARWSNEDHIDPATNDAIAASGGRLALVHRRLSILDLTRAGWQPMLTEDRRYAISFNGEVYNYRELRQELECLGHRFKSSSDTEVVLASWRQWGHDAFSRFTGMFAVAIVDLINRTLTLARDPFGIKPLYWTEWRGGVSFASEIPALLCLPGCEREISADNAYDFLAYGHSDRGETTMLEGIFRVPAGCCLKFDLESCKQLPVFRFWDPIIETNETMGEMDAVECLRETFIRSVSLHLRSDVPVGIALSGGIDSTSILGAVDQLGLNDNIKAFSFISEDPVQSEEKWIDLSAKHYSVDVHKIRPESGDFIDDLNRLMRSQGEPFATAGMFAQARVFECVQKLGIKVTLDGQGADELLAGYPTYMLARMADLFSDLRFGEIADMLSAIGFRTLPRSLLMAVAPRFDTAARRFHALGGFSPWLSKSWRKNARHQAFNDLVRRRDRLHDRLEQTFYDLSLPALLRYADRNSMAYSVESRVPFLTPDLVRLVMSMPSPMLIGKDGLTKSVFRQAMKGLVPDRILERRDKIGFAVPQNIWLAKSPDWLKAATERARENLPMLDENWINTQLKYVLAGNPGNDQVLWRCICLSTWIDQFSVDVRPAV